jgi:hypothetical protein
MTPAAVQSATTMLSKPTAWLATILSCGPAAARNSASTFSVSIVMIASLDHAMDHYLTVPAGLACATGWGGLGLALLAAAGRRCARVVHQHDAAVAQADQALDAEEAAAAKGSAEDEVA